MTVMAGTGLRRYVELWRLPGAPTLLGTTRKVMFGCCAHSRITASCARMISEPPTG